MEGQQYEFDRSQNELILDLSNKMRFVGYFLISVGILGIISGIIALFSSSPSLSINNFINGIVNMIFGVWINKAASSFKQIVDTQGNDIVNLMGALGELRKLFGLIYWLLIIALVFIVIGIVVGIILGILSAATN
ncbi:MAG: hypothetical protein WBA93_06805 [Microcoleaceae cyanobacterium]